MDDEARPHGRKYLEGVLRAGHLGVHEGRLGPLAEDPAEMSGLFDRHHRVDLPVDDEEGWRVAIDPADRRGLLVRLHGLGAWGLHHAPLEEPEEPVVRPDLVPVGEIVHAVERDAAAHRGVDVLEAGLVLGRVRGEGHERRQMAAGRAARDDHEVRIDTVLATVLPNPSQRPLEIDEMVGEGGARAQSVVRAHAHPATCGEMEHEGDALLVLAAEDPGTAVDLQERRAAARPGPRPVDVELEVAACDTRVGDVAHPLHLGVAPPERDDELAPVDGRGELGAHLGEDPLAVLVAEPFPQRPLDDPLGPPGRSVAAREPDPRPEHDAEPHDPRPGVQRPRPDEDGRHDRLPDDVMDR